jgi:biopolymer transport protein ExbD
MKIRRSTSSGKDTIELQMTPMIDIVFQLLVFFIMTFKIVSLEGDFNIQMPLASQNEGLPDENDLLPPMRLTLTANDDGQLSGISLNDRNFSNFGELHDYIASRVGDAGPSGSEDAEVELDCDYHLRYEYAIKAVTAVSGYVDRNTDEIVRLVEKIRFTPPRENAEATD